MSTYARTPKFDILSPAQKRRAHGSKIWRPATIMEIVECRSDTEYPDRPISLLWEGRRYEIVEIIARWRGPGEKGFRVKTTNGQGFELTYREVPDEWQIQPI